VNGIVEYRLIYGGQLAPVAKVDASGTTIETYIYGLGVNSPDYILKDGTKYRVIKDHLGSIRMIVDSSTGEIVKTLRYSEFGEKTEETGTFNTIFGFAGGIRDTDTDLTKFGARWYDSTTGRWMEKEPLGFAGSDNFYSYCDGDPVNWVDYSGNIAIVIQVILWGGGLYGIGTAIVAIYEIFEIADDYYSNSYSRCISQESDTLQQQGLDSNPDDFDVKMCQFKECAKMWPDILAKAAGIGLNWPVSLVEYVYENTKGSNNNKK